MDGELSYLAVVAVVVVVVIVLVGLSRNATSVVRLGTLPVNVACGLVQEVLAVEDVAAGAGAGAGAGAAATVPDTAGVRAIAGGNLLLLFIVNIFWVSNSHLDLINSTSKLFLSFKIDSILL
jgi:hypothetical protein